MFDFRKIDVWCFIFDVMLHHFPSLVLASFYIAVQMLLHPTKNMPRMLALGPAVGAVGLLMMSIYPLHIALGGEQWISLGCPFFRAKKLNWLKFGGEV